MSFPSTGLPRLLKQIVNRPADAEPPDNPLRRRCE